MLARTPLTIAMKVDLQNSRAERSFAIIVSCSCSKHEATKPKVRALGVGWTSKHPGLPHPHGGSVLPLQQERDEAKNTSHRLCGTSL